jgi:hypothetical protein
VALALLTFLAAGWLLPLLMACARRRSSSSSGGGGGERLLSGIGEGALEERTGPGGNGCEGAPSHHGAIMAPWYLALVLFVAAAVGLGIVAILPVAAAGPSPAHPTRGGHQHWVGPAGWPAVSSVLFYAAATPPGSGSAGVAIVDPTQPLTATFDWGALTVTQAGGAAPARWVQVVRFSPALRNARATAPPGSLMFGSPRAVRQHGDAALRGGAGAAVGHRPHSTPGGGCAGWPLVGGPGGVRVGELLGVQRLHVPHRAEPSHGLCWRPCCGTARGASAAVWRLSAARGLAAGCHRRLGRAVLPQRGSAGGRRPHRGLQPLFAGKRLYCGRHSRARRGAGQPKLAGVGGG